MLLAQNQISKKNTFTESNFQKKILSQNQISKINMLLAENQNAPTLRLYPTLKPCCNLLKPPLNLLEASFYGLLCNIAVLLQDLWHFKDWSFKPTPT